MIYRWLFFLHPCERVGAADGAFAADQRQLVLVNAKGVRAVTDRLIFVVDRDLVFLDIVRKFIGDIGQEQGSVSITAELISCCCRFFLRFNLSVSLKYLPPDGRVFEL